jgi:hypothetical protein
MANDTYSNTKRNIALALVMALSVALTASVAGVGAVSAGDSGTVESDTSDAVPAIAADTNASQGTYLALDPTAAEVGQGGTATFDVVLTNSSGGVGTYDNITVSVANTDAATITSISDQTGAGSQTNTVAADGSSATISAQFGGDTTDTGDVRVASVTVSAAGAGTTDLALSLSGSVFKENGLPHELDGTRGGSFTVTRPSSEVVVSPQSNTALSTSAVVYDVVLTNVNGGVGTFDEIHVDVADTPVATVASAQSSINGVDASATSSSRASFNATFGGDTADSGNVTLGSVRIAGGASGSTDLGVTVTGSIFDESGQPYDISGTQGASVAVKDPPNIGGNQVDDTDGDGKVDDFNGNGEPDRGDAQALFAALNSPEVTGNVDLLDYNNNGRVDRGDVQALFAQAS